ncbi:glycosyltransferase family 2 protein [Pseudodesulfovibrio sp.]|nr:glycosyltransferase family 2 protein [Pseudodesulfovibrio sp.]
MTTLSTIIPNYNHGDRIGDSLDSILSQSVQPDEVIVLDDGSTDDSVAVLKEYEARHDHIRLILLEENRGVVSGCNVLFKEARGEYIHGFPADDIVLPGAYERSMEQLKANPGAGVCCADYLMVDTVSGDLEQYRLGWRDQAGFMSPAEFAEQCKGWWVPSFTSFIKRDALAEAGYFHEDLEWHCDWFAYFVVAFRHGVCHVPAPFAARRRHGDAYGTAARRDTKAQEKVLRTLLEKTTSDAYRDVVGLFVRSGAMLFFNNEIDRLVMSDPELWSMDMMMLTQLPMSYRLASCKKHIDDIWDNRLDVTTEHTSLIREKLVDGKESDGHV